MPLLSLHGVSLRFAGLPVLDAVDLHLELGERVGLLGRNGTGKSSLLRVLNGSLAPGSGTVVREPGTRVAMLQQDVPLELRGPVRAYLQHVCGAATHDPAWQVETRVEHAASDLRLDLDAAVENLSAGTRRRVLLAAALVQNPELLLLDEPTNHLDLEAIEHLEEALLRRRGALVFVTHDRSFLSRIATRILDLDRGELRSYRSGYDAYCVTSEDERRVELDQDALFDKKLAQEEAWVRRGIKARRTRNEGRVRALEALRLERRARREDEGRVRAQVQDAARSGRIVLRTEDMSFDYGGAPVVRALTTTLQRGDRVGILGPNGCGKTTLLKLLLGELMPLQGTVTHGTKLEVAHFEQLHEAVDPQQTLFDHVAEGREMIRVGEGERHVVGYLRDFLFTNEQVKGPIAKLSGGERKRLQLARILARPCNVLVLDEPTNDLDLETMELLEDLLVDYPGTLLVVSHDRTFLDDVVTSTLVCEQPGVWNEYIGGYQDWLRQRPQPEDKRPTRSERNAAAGIVSRPRRASFKEKRELAELPLRIEALETEKHALFERMAAPGFYAQGPEQTASATVRLAALEREHQLAYARWQELDSLLDGSV